MYVWKLSTLFVNLKQKYYFLYSILKHFFDAFGIFSDNFRKGFTIPIKKQFNFCVKVSFEQLNISPLSLKGTGTRDLIWLKVVSLDRSWLVGLTDDL